MLMTCIGNGSTGPIQKLNVYQFLKHVLSSIPGLHEQQELFSFS